MKRFLTVFFSIIAFMNASSQEIIYDAVKKDGIRRVVSNTIDLSSAFPARAMGYSLQLVTEVNVQNQNHMYYLMIRHEANGLHGANIARFVPKGKLLFRLETNEVIELESFSIKEKHTVDTVTITQFGNFQRIMDIYDDKSCFLISGEQIEKLCQGVKKIRIETTRGGVDSIRNIAKKLRKYNEAIQERLTYGAQLETKKDIHEGF